MNKRWNLFQELMKKEVEQICEENLEVSLKEIPKNNGIVQSGLVFQEKGADTAAIVYLEEFFERYLEGEALPELALGIYRTYENHKGNTQITRADIDLDHYEAIKDKVVYKLVNYGRNCKLLKKIPHIRFCDLAVVFSLLIESSQKCQATALIYQEHIKRWGIDTKKLMELAERNTPRLFPAELKSMEQVLKGIAGTYLRSDYKEESFDNLSAEPVEIPLYVLSNQRNLHGAAVILYDGVLREFAGNMRRDLIILPSSIHEVLLIPYEEGSDLSELKQMVMYVNSTEVSEEEILSDHVYYYSRKTDSISIACEEPSDWA